RQPLDCEFAADGVADRLDQFAAQLDRIADRLAARGQIRKGNRRLAVGNGDCAAGACLLQRAGELLRRGQVDLRACRAARERQRARRQQLDESRLHAHALQACAGWADAAASSVNAYSSAASGGRSSPSHLATAAVAIELPTALVAERPMSRKVSTPRISSSPASGMLNCASVAAITTSDARGTPAMPFDVSIRMRSIVIWVPSDNSML